MQCYNNNFGDIFTFNFSFSPCANFKNFIRLSFAFIEEEEIDKGIEMMATALQNFLKL